MSVSRSPPIRATSDGSNPTPLSSIGSITSWGVVAKRQMTRSVRAWLTMLERASRAIRCSPTSVREGRGRATPTVSNRTVGFPSPEIPSINNASASVRPVQGRRRQIEDRPSCFIEANLGQIQRLMNGPFRELRIGADFQMHLGRLDLQGYGCESLASVSGISRAIRFRSSTALRFTLRPEQAGSLHRDAQKVSDRIQELWVIVGQLPPVGAGDIEQAQFLFLRSVQADAAWYLQPAGPVRQSGEPAASYDVDIHRAVEVLFSVNLQAISDAFQ